MNKSNLWRSVLAVSIAAFAVPAFAQSQTGSGSSSYNSGSSTMGSSGTMGSSSSSSSTGMGMMADRGMTQADNTLNQNIHQALNTDSALMSSAKNVYLNTDNGKVTMHGTVPTEKDKKDIEAKVGKMAGVKDVDNQLQIAPTTSSAAGSMHYPSSTK